MSRSLDNICRAEQIIIAPGLVRSPKLSFYGGVDFFEQTEMASFRSKRAVLGLFGALLIACMALLLIAVSVVLSFGPKMRGAGFLLGAAVVIFYYSTRDAVLAFEDRLAARKPTVKEYVLFVGRSGLSGVLFRSPNEEEVSALRVPIETNATITASDRI